MESDCTIVSASDIWKTLSDLNLLHLTLNYLKETNAIKIFLLTFLHNAFIKYPCCENAPITMLFIFSSVARVWYEKQI